MPGRGLGNGSKGERRPRPRARDSAESEKRERRKEGAGTLERLGRQQLMQAGGADRARERPETEIIKYG